LVAGALPALALLTVAFPALALGALLRALPRVFRAELALPRPRAGAVRLFWGAFPRLLGAALAPALRRAVFLAIRESPLSRLKNIMLRWRSRRLSTAHCIFLSLEGLSHGLTNRPRVLGQLGFPPLAIERVVA